MARKRNYINKIASKDAKMLKSMARTGYLSHDMIRRDLEIAERRITNFQRDKMIEKCSYFNRYTKQTENVYRLTDKGQKLVEQELGIYRFYRSSSPQHDLALASKYFTLSFTEQETWKTETEARDIFLEALQSIRDDELYEKIYEKYEEHQISAIDAIYTSDTGSIQGVEIITSSYGEAEITAKEEFSSIIGCDTEFIRT